MGIKRRSSRVDEEWYLNFMRKHGMEVHIGYETCDHYASDLRTDRSLRIDGIPQCLVIEGDLHVKGGIYIKDSCGLFVFGDVHTEELITDEGEVRIMGTLYATNRAEFGESGLPHIARLRTPMLVYEGMEEENPRVDSMYSPRLAPQD